MSSGAHDRIAPRGRAITIVTSAPVCSNPRVVKEADALCEAGFAVRVVGSQHVGWAVKWDEEIVQGRRWRYEPIRWDKATLSTWRLRLISGLRRRTFAALAARVTFEASIAEHAYARVYRELAARAASQPADLYIAHNPQALPAAAQAAARRGVPFAFDSEDFHTGETLEHQRDALPARLLRYLEAKYLPACIYVTTPSEPIARALSELYGLAAPLAIHNVFPWSERQKIDGARRDRVGSELSLYWFSQVVGLDRGIQDAVRAAALLEMPVHLHLRGTVSESVRRELEGLARSGSRAVRLFFHDKVPPADLVSRAVEHDIGLALESPDRANHDLTVSNKMFMYMLAGVAVAASDTVGQRGILSQCPEAGVLYPPRDHVALARGLRELIATPGRLEAAKRAALKAARERWNWEVESRRLVDLVERTLGGRSSRERPLRQPAHPGE